MHGFSLAVIIPNYNKEKYLISCIQSVLRQSLMPDEIIIVDDASTDNSRTTLKRIEFEHPNIRVILLEYNGGVSQARNTGLQYASTEYVTFLDSDDYYDNKDKLKNEMSIIRSYAQRGENVISYSAIVRISENNNIIYRPTMTEEWYLNGSIFYSLLAGRGAGKEPRDYCVKKETLLDVGAYSYPINYYEDLDLIIRLSQKVQFIFSKEIGTAYRDTPGGLSKHTPAESKKAVNAIKNTYIQKLPFLGRCVFEIERLYGRLEYYYFATKRLVRRACKKKE